MAGKFDVNSTTFMNRHTPGVNSTGMYLISGIPFIKDITGAHNAFIPFLSLSREVTISCKTVGGEDPSVTVHFDDTPGAGTQSFTMIAGETLTLPIRCKGVHVTTVGATTRVTVLATLTGIDGDPYDNYPRLKGDGTLTKK